MEDIRLTPYELTVAIAERATVLEQTTNPTTLTQIEMHNLRTTLLRNIGVDPNAGYTLNNGSIVKQIDLFVLQPQHIAAEEFRLRKMPMSVRKPSGNVVDINNLIRRTD